MSRLYLILFTCCFHFFVFSQNEVTKLLKYADELQKKGDFVYALDYYNKALEIDSSSIVALWNYAECLRNYKDYKNAEKYYKIIFTKDEGFVYPIGILYLGLMQKQNGKYDEALETFKYVKKRFSKDKKAYIYLKSKREIESCLWAKSAILDTLKVNINPLPETVNSKNSEFGHFIRDSKLYLSSLRPDSTTQDEEVFSKNYKTNIYSSKLDNNKFQNANQVKGVYAKNFNSGNGSFSLDGKRFYFSRCNENGAYYSCKIMVAKYIDTNFTHIDSLGTIINAIGANTTMPLIASIDGVETLIFASDRKGSIGGLDLWISQIKNGSQFSEPKPISSINTIENEITPWWDTKNQRLYFATSWLDGFGGNDVYYSEYTNQFNEPKNAGIPINSSANDIYFFKNNDTAYVTSNRIGVMFSKNPTCCSDIFEIKPIIEKKIITHQDSNLIKLETLAELNKRLPVTLYFHNDVPDPKSKDSTSHVNYINSYFEYKSMVNKYQTEYSAGLKGSKADEAKEDIESFFIEYVDQGVKDLSIFRDLLLQELQNGAKIRVTIKGFASPLAKSNYNVNLTKRRIASLANYLNEYNNGVFKPFIENNSENGGYVKIVEVPFGEYTANQLTSDNPNDEKNSIYSRAAAIERKIEIQSVSYIEKDTISNKNSLTLIAEKQIIDLGEINDNETIKKEFTVKNNGNKTIIIEDIRIPCICNTVELSNYTLAPNESTKVTMSFNPKGYSGQTVKSIYLKVKNQDDELRLILTSDVNNEKK